MASEVKVVKPPPEEKARGLAGASAGETEEVDDEEAEIMLVARSSAAVASPDERSHLLRGGPQAERKTTTTTTSTGAATGVDAAKSPAQSVAPASSEVKTLVSGEGDAKPASSDAAATAAKTEVGAQDAGLLVAFGLFVLTSLGNRLFQKLMTLPMYNYPVAINLLTTAAYVPTSFTYIAICVHCVQPSPITADQIAIPKSRFAVMGALDCVSSLMQILSVNFIPNASTLVLLQQSAIPISMIISRLSFKHVRYDWWQVSGAAVVLCGIGVVLAPQASTGSARDASDGPLPQWVWQLTIILSCVPMTLSSVYKEKALGEHDVDVVYLNGWVAVFQTFLCLPLAIPTAMAIELPLDRVPKNVIDGCLCFVGRNTITIHDALSRPPDECATAPYFVTAFVAFNIVYNILIVVILKRGSSSLLYLGSTLLVPISNVMFSLKIFPGHKPLHVADVAGMPIIMFGLVLYRCGSALATFLRAPERLAILAKLLLVDIDDDEEDEDEARPPMMRPRDYLKIPPAERRTLLAAARRRGDEDPPSPLFRESLRATRTHLKTDKKAHVARFFGLNQIEMLQPLVQAQSLQARHRLARSNAQIRQDFLQRLGFSPEPTFASFTSPRSPRPALGQSSRPRHLTSSPGDIRRMRARQGASSPGRGGLDAHYQPPAGAAPRRLPGRPPTFVRLDPSRRANSFDTRGRQPGTP
ncbi:hypothetical protein CTAYLR_007573 [Chrysophaeum taylorii]|uniref:Uncharacterized protein n=1 Tax=Chrysophaeum taylorii TaxID=2483200 RepID=A0AAD7UE14_9STRA|nr:hypothetical protein CTAYLR_007573 [Chrysophaeum taylorii]